MIKSIMSRQFANASAGYCIKVPLVLIRHLFSLWQTNGDLHECAWEHKDDDGIKLCVTAELVKDKRLNSMHGSIQSRTLQLHQHFSKLHLPNQVFSNLSSWS